ALPIYLFVRPGQGIPGGGEQAAQRNDPVVVGSRGGTQPFVTSEQTSLTMPGLRQFVQEVVLLKRWSDGAAERLHTSKVFSGPFFLAPELLDPRFEGHEVLVDQAEQQVEDALAQSFGAGGGVVAGDAVVDLGLAYVHVFPHVFEGHRPALDAQLDLDV